MMEKQNAWRQEGGHWSARMENGSCILASASLESYYIDVVSSFVCLLCYDDSGRRTLGRAVVVVVIVVVVYIHTSAYQVLLLQTLVIDIVAA